MVGLGNVDNTADLLKPISTDTQTALDLKATNSDLALKAPLASPTFTGTVSGVTASMVGLGNVDNTADLLKPISTDTQAALDLKATNLDLALKAPLASPAFTGTPTAVTQLASDSSTALATTKYVTDANAVLVSMASNALSTSLNDYLPLTGGNLSGDLFGTNLSGTNTGDDAINSRYQGLESNATHTGEVTGSSVLTIANNAITTLKIADASVTNDKIDTVNGSKVMGNILGNAANVTGTVALANGGTGATTAAAALTSLGAAPIASPAFTGTPTAITQAPSDDSNALATTAFVKNAATETSALAIKDITPNEIALSTKINGSQLYAITGSFDADGDSTSFNIQLPSNISGYYTFVTYQNGKTFRKEVYSLNINNGLGFLITGSGPYSEVYPSGTYEYVLEYFKNQTPN